MAINDLRPMPVHQLLFFLLLFLLFLVQLHITVREYSLLEAAPNNEDPPTAGAADVAALSYFDRLPSPKSFPTKNPCTLC